MSYFISGKNISNRDGIGLVVRMDDSSKWYVDSSLQFTKLESSDKKQQRIIELDKEYLVVDDYRLELLKEQMRVALWEIEFDDHSDPIVTKTWQDMRQHTRELIDNFGKTIATSKKVQSKSVRIGTVSPNTKIMFTQGKVKDAIAVVYKQHELETEVVFLGYSQITRTFPKKRYVRVDNNAKFIFAEQLKVGDQIIFSDNRETISEVSHKDQVTVFCESISRFVWDKNHVFEQPSI